MVDDLQLHLALVLGPTEDSPPIGVLKRAWKVFGPEMMKRSGDDPRPDRPWGFWRFNLGEEPPGSYQEQIIRLMELGELTDDEIRAVERRAGEALRAADWADHVEAAGAVTVGPAGALERMRERRAADREEWRRVLARLT